MGKEKSKTSDRDAELQEFQQKLSELLGEYKVGLAAKLQETGMNMSGSPAFIAVVTLVDLTRPHGEN